MERFDDWVTDPAVTRAGVDAFVADRGRIGERFLGAYVVWKSSGTTGEPGIYVQDADALDVCDALVAAQLDAAGLMQPFAQGLIAHGGRAALIAATGEHFATVASRRRLGGGAAWPGARCLSVLDPLPRLVAELNAQQPAFVASYPTMLSLLAAEQDAGRLAIAPRSRGARRRALRATICGASRCRTCASHSTRATRSPSSAAASCARCWWRARTAIHSFVARVQQSETRGAPMRHCP